MKYFRIAEEGDYELPVIPTLGASGHHLMYHVVNSAVQKIIPGILEEHVLRKEENYVMEKTKRGRQHLQSW